MHVERVAGAAPSSAEVFVTALRAAQPASSSDRSAALARIVGRAAALFHGTVRHPADKVLGGLPDGFDGRGGVRPEVLGLRFAEMRPIALAGIDRFTPAEPRQQPLSLAGLLGPGPPGEEEDGKKGEEGGRTRERPAGPVHGGEDQEGAGRGAEQEYDCGRQESDRISTGIAILLNSHCQPSRGRWSVASLLPRKDTKSGLAVQRIGDGPQARSSGTVADSVHTADNSLRFGQRRMGSLRQL